MAKKRTIFRVKKNRYGNPILSARVPVKYTFKGDEYTELHIYATLASFSFTLRNPSNYRLKVGSSALWENLVRWRGVPMSETVLVEAIKEMIESFKNGNVPSWVPSLRPQEFTDVLI